MSCGIVRGMHHESRVQEEPRNSHGNNHVHGKGTHAVLRIGAALDEKRRDGARSQQHQAAVHGAVGHAVIRVSKVPQVVADDPEPQLVGPHEVLLLAATNNNAEETADADGVQNAGNAIHNVPGAADNHVAVYHAVDAGKLEVADACLKNVDGKDDGRNAYDVLLLESGEVHDQPAQNGARQTGVGFHPLEPGARAGALHGGVGPNEDSQNKGQCNKDGGAEPFIQTR